MCERCWTYYPHTMFDKLFLQGTVRLYYLSPCMKDVSIDLVVDSMQDSALTSTPIARTRMFCRTSRLVRSLAHTRSALNASSGALGPTVCPRGISRNRTSSAHQTRDTSLHRSVLSPSEIVSMSLTPTPSSTPRSSSSVQIEPKSHNFPST